MLALRKVDGNDPIVRPTLVKHPFRDRRATLRIVIEFHRITSQIVNLQLNSYYHSTFSCKRRPEQMLPKPWPKFLKIDSLTELPDQRLNGIAF